MIENIAKEYMALIPNLFAGFSMLNKETGGLTHMQNHVIEYMYMQRKALNLKDISAGLNIAKQQLTNIIKDLENGGYVIKKPDTKDKRAILVILTPAGKNIEEQKWAKIYQNLSADLSKLSDEEQLDFNFALHKVNVLLKKMGESK